MAAKLAGILPLMSAEEMHDFAQIYYQYADDQRVLTAQRWDSRGTFDDLRSAGLIKTDSTDGTPSVLVFHFATEFGKRYWLKARKMCEHNFNQQHHDSDGSCYVECSKCFRRRPTPPIMPFKAEKCSEIAPVDDSPVKRVVGGCLSSSAQNRFMELI